MKINYESTGINCGLEGMFGQLIPVDLQLIFSGTQFGAWSGGQGLGSLVLGGVLIFIIDLQLICS